MRRPKAPRRRRVLAFDRRMAAVAFGLAGVAMFATVALARTSAPVAERSDPASGAGPRGAHAVGGARHAGR